MDVHPHRHDLVGAEPPPEERGIVGHAPPVAPVIVGPHEDEGVVRRPADRRRRRTRRARGRRRGQDIGPQVERHALPLGRRQVGHGHQGVAIEQPRPRDARVVSAVRDKSAGSLDGELRLGRERREDIEAVAAPLVLHRRHEVGPAGPIDRHAQGGGVEVGEALRRGPVARVGVPQRPIRRPGEVRHVVGPHGQGDAVVGHGGSDGADAPPIAAIGAMEALGAAPAQVHRAAGPHRQPRRLSRGIHLGRCRVGIEGGVVDTRLLVHLAPGGPGCVRPPRRIEGESDLHRRDGAVQRQARGQGHGAVHEHEAALLRPEGPQAPVAVRCEHRGVGHRLIPHLGGLAGAMGVAPRRYRGGGRLRPRQVDGIADDEERAQGGGALSRGTVRRHLRCDGAGPPLGRAGQPQLGGPVTVDGPLHPSHHDVAVAVDGDGGVEVDPRPGRQAHRLGGGRERLGARRGGRGAQQEHEERCGPTEPSPSLGSPLLHAVASVMSIAARRHSPAESENPTIRAPPV